ncbi:MMPL family transporter [Nocardia sp. alder85J]|uniref:MMPL family transporter n=1 Tax=Nocardia sp. alder85J TaxID=2862949 RepID=UPI001CD475CA|nr:MMPL family transporter [Nocardia sp. alder85J]MCX4096329.1 MMPL family transporter [Nocardia sp. alder85J]
MFTRWGDLVYRLRYTVLGVVVAALLALGGYGLGLEDHLSSSGWDDPNSESSQAAQLLDRVYGRDHTSDVIVLYSAPDGGTVDDPAFADKVTTSLAGLTQLPEITGLSYSYWKVGSTPATAALSTKDKKSAFVSVAIKGDNDTDEVKNYRKVKDAFTIPGVKVQVAGLQTVSGTLNDTMSADQRRMEIIAIPAVAVLLFFIFGGVVAAALPLIVGGLTVVGANGIVRIITNFTEVNSFVSPVVSMIGLGLAIDYGLFIVSRFREEMAEGYDTRAAVRRSVMTAGRTVLFSATMIIAASAGMLLFPQGFLKSVAYGTIATVLLAAVSAVTVLPAMLAILGKRVDKLGLKWFRKNKTAEEIESGFWGRLPQWVMKHPLKVAIPLCIILLLLIIPVKNLKFGGISETYLPPDNPTRVAQADFDKLFPLRKTNPIQLVLVTDNTSEIGAVVKKASQAPGLTSSFSTPGKPPNGSNVWQTSSTLKDADTADATIDYLRSMDVPGDVKVLIGGQPAIQKDSIDALMSRMPLMIALGVLVTTILLFLTFGSLVLPIKAALMSALGLGSTLGILTWIFVDGHGAGVLNFTPQPIMSPVLVLIIAVIYGLSTDYEVFLLSRMVEARSQGASTTEAVRIGTAQTGRIITAAALILLVVTGAFAFSDLVMMQYIAYGMIAALFIDATVLRMLLVPAIMKLLGDDCWWAPRWMKRIQQRIGLGEPMLHDDRPHSTDVLDLVKATPITDPVTMQMPMLADGTPAKPARKLRRPRFISGVDGEAPTERIGGRIMGRWGSGFRSSELPAVPAPAAETAAPKPAPAEPTPPTGVSTPATPAEGTVMPQAPLPGVPPRTVTPPAADAPDTPIPMAPLGATPRVLPPQPGSVPKVPPHPADRAQLYQPHEADPGGHGSLKPDVAPTGRSSASGPAHAAADEAESQEPPTTPVPARPADSDTPGEPPADSEHAERDSIEQWMANLRSSRPESDETAKAPGGGRTVSVNELLRRRNSR